MVIIRERPHMYFDVDSTLVEPLDGPVDIFREDIIAIGDFFFRINMRVIKDLKLCRTRGHVVVVWSQGGSSWAATVVQKLGLEKFVDICIAKPSWYIDDRKPEDILDKSRWYDGSF